MKGAISVEK